MRSQFRARPASDRGATSVEYALFMALVALVIVGAVTAFGHAVTGLFTTAESVFP